MVYTTTTFNCCQSISRPVVQTKRHGVQLEQIVHILYLLQAPVRTLDLSLVQRHMRGISSNSSFKIKANQIRERVAGQAFIVGLEAIQVTISIGIAHFPQDGTTAAAVMQAADRALYAAKAAGRNCVLEAAKVA